MDKKPSVRLPLKAGPNNTWRAYNPRNGRYAKMDDEAWLALQKSNKMLTKEEKRKKRTAFLRERAYQSKDKYLKEVFDYIESRIPHYVQQVNENIYVPKDRRPHEIDIIGKNAIIEIKSGKNHKCIRQLSLQKEVADKRGLKTIMFAPLIPYRAAQEFIKKGIVVVRTKEELYKEIKHV